MIQHNCRLVYSVIWLSAIAISYVNSTAQWLGHGLQQLHFRVRFSESVEWYLCWTESRFFLVFSRFSRFPNPIPIILLMFERPIRFHAISFSFFHAIFKYFMVKNHFSWLGTVSGIAESQMSYRQIRFEMFNPILAAQSKQII